MNPIRHIRMVVSIALSSALIQVAAGAWRTDVCDATTPLACVSPALR
jgi:hypothetical protein